MDDFLEGNIVVLLGTTTGELPRTTVDLERLYSSSLPVAPGDHHSKYEAFRDRKIKAIEAGELTFVEMQRAIGANMLATCERVGLRFHGNGS